MNSGLKSMSFYKDICELPSIDGPYGPFETTMNKLFETDRDRFSVELSMGVDRTLRTLLDGGNVPDESREELRKAYSMSFSNSDQSLEDHYRDILGRCENASEGFISNLKGKVAELRAVSTLESNYPDHDFMVHPNPIEPVSDIIGSPPLGSEDLPVQIKMGNVDYASNVADRMQEHPNILFGLGSELYDKIAESRPDLSQKSFDLGISNSDLTEEIRRSLGIMSGNNSFDVPDSVGDILDMAGPAIVGIKILINLVMVERDYNEVELDERARIHALTALLLMSKFGVTAVCTTLGSALGTIIPGPGNVAGIIGGAGISLYVNRQIGPKIRELTALLVNLDEEELFYLRHKLDIDKIGESLMSTKVRYIQN